MPYDETAIFLVRETLIITLKIAAPMLAAGVLVGLIISIVQAVTSIQDQTLVFVPKITVMVLVAAAIIPWLIARLVEYAAAMFTLA